MPSKKPGAQGRSTPRPQRGPRGGLGWLFLFVAGGGILAVFIFAPDFMRGLFGPAGVPRQLGDEPSLAQQQDGDLLTREVAIEPRQLSGEATGLAARPQEPEDTPDLPAREAEAPAFQDATRGQDILRQAEEAYANYQWDEARTLASSLRDLEVDPSLQVRAQDIVEGTRRLKDLFQVLGTREELVRNLETHPSLVEVTMRGHATRLIPVSDLAEKEPVEVANPEEWLREQLANRGEVPVVFENNIASMLSASDVSEVRSAQVDELIAERRQLIDQRVAEFEDDVDMRNDPMTWYEAAKFAYRNRVDDRVVEMLDRALLLSPDLGQTIREDAAREWFTKLVMALDAGNRAAANGYMVQIRRYEDTLVFPQAVAYYDGNIEALRDARQRAVAQREEQRDAARQRRLERAQAQGKDEAVAEVKREVAEEQAVAERRAQRGASGDMSSADAAFDRGMAIYQEAQSMGATRERDGKYKEARKHFLEALDVYAAAVEGGDSSLETKMTRTNQLQYACMKYARAF